jgi:hypothetical protein
MARPHTPLHKSHIEETKIRLTPEADEAATREAERRGIPKAVLLRSWIMEKLAEKLNHDVAA